MSEPASSAAWRRLPSCAAAALWNRQDRSWTSRTWRFPVPSGNWDHARSIPRLTSKHRGVSAPPCIVGVSGFLPVSVSGNSREAAPTSHRRGWCRSSPGNIYVSRRPRARIPDHFDKTSQGGRSSDLLDCRTGADGSGFARSIVGGSQLTSGQGNQPPRGNAADVSEPNGPEVSGRPLVSAVRNGRS